MSILFDTVYRYETTSTHHKLALDALRHLRGKQAEAWQRLFLRYYEDYLEGTTAPDQEFRDFRNHVLHVSDGYWGGAVKAAVKWYDRAVESLAKQDFVEAIYCAGVLSHYFTDVLMPFHTGQSEEESKVHRAFEWSVAVSYDQILPLVAEYPSFETPAGDNWLEQMMRQAAGSAYKQYDLFVSQYDLDRGRSKPQDGLNEELRSRVADLLAHGIIGTSRILERMFQDASAKPPSVRIGAMGLLTRLTSPFGRLSQFRAHRQDRRVVRRIHREFQRTGCVVDSLPPDEREVRRAHAEEVLKIDEAELNRLTREAGVQRREEHQAAVEQQRQERREEAQAAKQQRREQAKQARQAEQAEKAKQAEEAKKAKQAKKAEAEKSEPATAEPQGPAIVKITSASTGDDRGRAAPPTYHLQRQSPVGEAPSIGSKTARRLQKIQVRTVDDLLAINPDEAAEQLNSGYMTPEVLRDWQRQAALVCRIPNLRGHDAQMLVGAKVSDPQIIANMAPGALLDRIEEYLLSEEGERLLSRVQEPNREEVTNWIRWAQQARKLAAA